MAAQKNKTVPDLARKLREAGCKDKWVLVLAACLTALAAEELKSRKRLLSLERAMKNHSGKEIAK